MSVGVRLVTVMLWVTLAMGFGAPAKAQTQEKQQHVVTTDELSQQVARPAEARQSNEEKPSDICCLRMRDRMHSSPPTSIMRG